ncbi:MAG: gluconolaconase, partial [Chloroflexota bacterium]
MMTMTPELVADTRCEVGEGPLWHEDERCLYWLDIPPGHLYRYDPGTGQHARVLDAGEAIGGFTIEADGALLLFMARGAVRRWQHGALTTVLDGIPGEEDSRFNDVIADPEGRVFCGTMPSETHLGRLYRLDPGGKLILLLEGIDISNGLGFTPDLTGLYYTESNARVIYQFDYDRATGTIANQRIFVRVAPEDGVPDGMTVDAEGYVWSARWDGSSLVRHDPNGIEVLRIRFPAKKVSSVTFGGPDASDLYVTTAGGTNRAAEGAGAG